MIYKINKIETMIIQKKLIKESLGDYSKSKKTISTKKQNIVLTEKQLEYILSKLQKNV